MLISFIVVLFIETKCLSAGGHSFRDGPKSYFQVQQSKALMVSHTEIYVLNRLIQPELCMTLYCTHNPPTKGFPFTVEKELCHILLISV